MALEHGTYCSSITASGKSPRGWHEPDIESTLNLPTTTLISSLAFSELGPWSLDPMSRLESKPWEFQKLIWGVTWAPLDWIFVQSVKTLHFIMGEQLDVMLFHRANLLEFGECRPASITVANISLKSRGLKPTLIFGSGGKL